MRIVVELLDQREQVVGRQIAAGGNCLPRRERRGLDGLQLRIDEPAIAEPFVSRRHDRVDVAERGGHVPEDVVGDRALLWRPLQERGPVLLRATGGDRRA